MVTIVTAGDANFKAMILEALERVSRFGYTAAVFDLGGLGFGEPLQVRDGDLNRAIFIPCTFKVNAVRQALASGASDYYVWMDADAILVDRIDEVFTGNYDVGLTERDSAEQKKHAHKPMVGRINSGVMIFRNSAKLPALLDRWQAASVQFNSDQHGMNHLLDTETSVTFRLFPNRIYNNYYTDVKTPGMKIRHYRGELKALRGYAW